MNKFPKKTMLLALVGALLTACGGAENGVRQASSTPSTTLTGTVSKGPVNAATVNIYQIKADGTRGEKVAGPFITKADGSWDGQIPAGINGPFILVATGGSYIDEATGVTIKLESDDELVSVLESTKEGKSNAPITPYTHAVALAAQQMVTDGKSTDIAVKQAIQAATLELGFNPTTVLPPNPLNPPANASIAEKQYAAMLGGFSQLAQDDAIKLDAPDVAPGKLIRALVKDLADGKLDGKDLSGKTITLPGNNRTINLPVLGNSWQKLTDSTKAFVATHTAQYPDLKLAAPEKGFYNKPIHMVLTDGSQLSCDTINSQVISKLNNGYLDQILEYVGKADRLVNVNNDIANHPSVIDYVGKDDSGKAKVKGDTSSVLLDPYHKDDKNRDKVGKNAYYEIRHNQDLHIGKNGLIYFANGKAVADDISLGLCTYRPANAPNKAMYFVVDGTASNSTSSTSTPTPTTGYVWEDLNANGVRESGELGVSGITVRLWNNANESIIETTNTDSTGAYQFKTPNTTNYSVEIVTPQNHGRSNNGGIYRLASISGVYWDDSDGDSAKVSNGTSANAILEMPPITVKLYDSNNNVIANTLTNVQGQYSFNNLVPGAYRVQFSLPSGYTFTKQNATVDDNDSDANVETGITDIYTLISGTRNTTVDAGIIRAMSLLNVDQTGLMLSPQVNVNRQSPL